MILIFDPRKLARLKASSHPLSNGSGLSRDMNRSICVENLLFMLLLWFVICVFGVILHLKLRTNSTSLKIDNDISVTIVPY